MKIAILMPYYNVSDTIIETLESIYKQTYKNFVLFAVNNASSDDSYVKILDYTHGKINTVHLYCDTRGIVPALNTGLFKILSKTDEFDAVARIDGDDIWLPEKLEKQVSFLNDNPNIDVVGTQISYFRDDPEDTEEKLAFPTDNLNIIYNLFKNCNVIAHPSVLIRINVYLKVGVYENLYNFAEDYQFWLKAAKFCKFANLSEYLVKYRLRDPNPKYDPSVPTTCRDYYGLAIFESIEKKKK